MCACSQNIVGALLSQLKTESFVHEHASSSCFRYCYIPSFMGVNELLAYINMHLPLLFDVGFVSA